MLSTGVCYCIPPHALADISSVISVQVREERQVMLVKEDRMADRVSMVDQVIGVLRVKPGSRDHLVTKAKTAEMVKMVTRYVKDGHVFLPSGLLPPNCFY